MENSRPGTRQLRVFTGADRTNRYFQIPSKQTNLLITRARTPQQYTVVRS